MSALKRLAMGAALAFIALLVLAWKSIGVAVLIERSGEVPNALQFGSGSRGRRRTVLHTQPMGHVRVGWHASYRLSPMSTMHMEAGGHAHSTGSVVVIPLLRKLLDSFIAGLTPDRRRLGFAGAA